MYGYAKKDCVYITTVRRGFIFLFHGGTEYDALSGRAVCRAVTCSATLRIAVTLAGGITIPSPITIPGAVSTIQSVAVTSTIAIADSVTAPNGERI